MGLGFGPFDDQLCGLLYGLLQRGAEDVARCPALEVVMIGIQTPSILKCERRCAMVIEVHHCNVGLDPGFGGFKAACIGSGSTWVVTMPSVVGVGETDMGLLSLGALGRRRRSRQPDQVTFDNVTYLVGEGVARYARPVERMDFLRLRDGPELRALSMTSSSGSSVRVGIGRMSWLACRWR